MSNKLHKPGENSQATLNRQGKHIRVKDKPSTTEVIPEQPLVNMEMTKKELELAADALDLSTKGSKIDLVERINAI